jgi:hypothetical protein
MRTSIVALVALALAIPSMAHAEDPERVVMKLEDFLDMHEKSKKPAEEPPRDHAIASARYDGEVLFEDGKPYAARFKLRMRVKPLRKTGYARIPLLPATVAVQSAKIGGAEAPVFIEGGFYTLITDRRTDFDIDMVIGAAVTSKEGSSGVEFQLVPAGATSLTLAVPAKEELDFTVANAKLKSDKVVGGNRVVEATIPATGSLSISWQRKVDEATEKKEPRVYTEVYTLTSLGDGIVTANAAVQNTILFAGVDEFMYTLPPGMIVLDVQGPGIRSWKAEGETLEVALNFAAEGSYGLTIQLEKPLEEGKDVVAPIVAPVGVERARGWVGVESRGNLELNASEVSGATPVDVRALPASILGVTDQPVLLGYKYLGAQPTIALQAAQHDEVEVLVTLLDLTVARTMWTREGRRLTSVTYQVRNNRRQFLKLALPEQAELWSASVSGRAVQPAKGSDGRVMLPLVRSQQRGNTLSAFQVEVVYVENGKEVGNSGRGTFLAQLPVADVPSTYVAWTVYSPDRTKVRKWTVDGNLERVESLSFPIPLETQGYVDVPQQAEQVANDAQAARKSLGGQGMALGAAPVMVSLPLQGEATHFEKLLALDEALTVEFAFRGLRKK